MVVEVVEAVLRREVALVAGVLGAARVTETAVEGLGVEDVVARPVETVGPSLRGWDWSGPHPSFADLGDPSWDSRVGRHDQGLPERERERDEGTLEVYH